MSFAYSKKVKSSVYKAILVAKLVKGLSVPNAILQLQFSKKSIANRMLNILNSAIANTKINNIDYLYIAEIKVNKDVSLKRSKPRSKGNVSRIVKPYVRIELSLKAIT